MKYKMNSLLKWTYLSSTKCSCKLSKGFKPIWMLEFTRELGGLERRIWVENLYSDGLLSLGSCPLAAWNESIYRLEEVKLGQQEEENQGAPSGWSGRLDEQYRMSAPQLSAFPRILLNGALCGSFCVIQCRTALWPWDLHKTLVKLFQTLIKQL